MGYENGFPGDRQTMRCFCARDRLLAGLPQRMPRLLVSNVLCSYVRENSFTDLFCVVPSLLGRDDPPPWVAFARKLR
jgi:hypothetical protein